MRATDPPCEGRYGNTHHMVCVINAEENTACENDALVRYNTIKITKGSESPDAHMHGHTCTMTSIPLTAPDQSFTSDSYTCDAFGMFRRQQRCRSGVAGFGRT